MIGRAQLAMAEPKQDTFKNYLRDTYGIAEVYFNGDTEISVVLPPIEYKRGKSHVRNNVGKKIANEYAAHIGLKPVTCIVLKEGKMYVKINSD